MSDIKPSTPTYRAISSLHNWEHNPRTVTKQGIERLIRQIKKLGVYKPLLITEDGTVLGGNMRPIKNSSKEDDIVLDLFCGSGTTVIACEQLGRVAYVAEKDPRYCDVIRKRYDNFVLKTGQKQEK